MPPLRLIVSAVLAAAAVAGCFTYLVSSPEQVEADQRLPPAGLNFTDLATGALADMNHRTGEEEKAAAYQRAAAAILRRAPNTRAFVATDDPPITGPIPLPRRRPTPRQ